MKTIKVRHDQWTELKLIKDLFGKRNQVEVMDMLLACYRLYGGNMK